MYLGIDVGGTKTLVAVLDADGVISEQVKFPTPREYQEFLRNLTQAVGQLRVKDFKAAGAGIPASVFDREHGRAVNFPNLPWRNVMFEADVEAICHCPVAVENDAKLAGLSEAMLVKERYRKVLYVTVSTGIGIALVNQGVIDLNLGDGGGAPLLLEHEGKLMPWEDFASGRAIVARFGKKASEITDEATWRIICRDLAKGLIHLIAFTEPEVIIIGGSVGSSFEKYGPLLATELASYQLPMVTTPPLVAAQRPELAVIYGCYDFVKQRYAHAATTR